MAKKSYRSIDKSNMERLSQVIDRVLARAAKQIRKADGTLPPSGYSFQLKDDMSFDEELLGIYHALIRAGVRPDEAVKRASFEIQRIYSTRGDIGRTEQ